MEVVQTRHNRHGLAGDCSLSAFGDIPSCSNHPNDNNGLWTSLIVGAESFRYLVTGAEDAMSNATTYFMGMRLLNQITGISGLMARSLTSPDEPLVTGYNWHNSTVPGYEGWRWEGDTSSDEVVGHMFAYSIFSKAFNNSNPEVAALAVDLINDIVTYIVENDYFLIDVTGLPTEWGIWNPNYINFNRSWCDERYELNFCFAPESNDVVLKWHGKSASIFLDSLFPHLLW
jgi:hypothetical protein